MATDRDYYNSHIGEQINIGNCRDNFGSVSIYDKDMHKIVNTVAPANYQYHRDAETERYHLETPSMNVTIDGYGSIVLSNGKLAMDDRNQLDSSARDEIRSFVSAWNQNPNEASHAILSDNFSITRLEKAPPIDRMPEIFDRTTVVALDPSRGALFVNHEGNNFLIHTREPSNWMNSQGESIGFVRAIPVRDGIPFTGGTHEEGRNILVPKENITVDITREGNFDGTRHCVDIEKVYSVCTDRSLYENAHIEPEQMHSFHVMGYYSGGNYDTFVIQSETDKSIHIFPYQAQEITEPQINIYGTMLGKSLTPDEACREIARIDHVPNEQGATVQLPVDNRGEISLFLGNREDSLSNNYFHIDRDYTKCNISTESGRFHDVERNHFDKEYSHDQLYDKMTVQAYDKDRDILILNNPGNDSYYYISAYYSHGNININNHLTPSDRDYCYNGSFEGRDILVPRQEITLDVAKHNLHQDSPMIAKYELRDLGKYFKDDPRIYETAHLEPNPKESFRIEGYYHADYGSQTIVLTSERDNSIHLLNTQSVTHKGMLDEYKPDEKYDRAPMESIQYVPNKYESIELPVDRDGNISIVQSDYNHLDSNAIQLHEIRGYTVPQINENEFHDKEHDHDVDRDYDLGPSDRGDSPEI